MILKRRRLGAVYKGRLANGEGEVLKFRTFPDGGGGGLLKFGRPKNLNSKFSHSPLVMLFQYILSIFIVKNRYTLMLLFKHLQITTRGQLPENQLFGV